jgi:hypothetical protein
MTERCFIRWFAGSLALAVVMAWMVPSSAATLKQEPPMGKLKTGERVLVDDGSCPPGQIKQVIGGDYYQTDGTKKKFGVERQRRCIAR